MQGTRIEGKNEKRRERRQLTQFTPTSCERQRTKGKAKGKRKGRGRRQSPMNSHLKRNANSWGTDWTPWGNNSLPAVKDTERRHAGAHLSILLKNLIMIISSISALRILTTFFLLYVFFLLPFFLCCCFLFVPTQAGQQLRYLNAKLKPLQHLSKKKDK